MADDAFIVMDNQDGTWAVYHTIDEKEVRGDVEYFPRECEALLYGKNRVLGFDHVQSLHAVHRRRLTEARTGEWVL